MSKKLISLALFGLLLSSISQIGFAEEAKKKSCNGLICKTIQKMGKTKVIIAATILGLGVYRLNSKTALPEPQSNFDFSKLIEAIKTFNLKDTADQLWFFTDEKLIGQPYKKACLKANKEGVVEISKGTPPTGLLGNISSNIFSISAGLFLINQIAKFDEDLEKAIENLKLRN